MSAPARPSSHTIPRPPPCAAGRSNNDAKPCWLLVPSWCGENTFDHVLPSSRGSHQRVVGLDGEIHRLCSQPPPAAVAQAQHGWRVYTAHEPVLAAGDGLGSVHWPAGDSSANRSVKVSSFCSIQLRRAVGDVVSCGPML